MQKICSYGKGRKLISKKTRIKFQICLSLEIFTVIFFVVCKKNVNFVKKLCILHV